MTYPLTLQIIREYLATLGPDDSAGIVADAFNCPAARAAEHKYGMPFVVTEWHYAPRKNVEFTVAITTPEIVEFIRRIDLAGNVLEPISRSEVEGAVGL